MTRIELGDLPTDLSGADMTGFAPVTARALLQDAVLNAPDPAVTDALAAVQAAMQDYRDQRRARRALLEVMEGLVGVLETGASLAIKMA